MIISKIDIIGLQRDASAGHCSADLCLHMHGEDGAGQRRAHLHCRATDPETGDAHELTARLIEEAKRQIGRMPEVLLGRARYRIAKDARVHVQGA